MPGSDSFVGLTVTNDQTIDANIRVRRLRNPESSYRKSDLGSVPLEGKERNEGSRDARGAYGCTSHQ